MVGSTRPDACTTTGVASLSMTDGNHTVVETREPDDEPTTLRPTLDPKIIGTLPATQESDVLPARGSSPGVGPGGRVGKYQLQARLGQGAFGFVYSAWDSELDRDVALK